MSAPKFGGWAGRVRPEALVPTMPSMAEMLRGKEEPPPTPPNLPAQAPARAPAAIPTDYAALEFVRTGDPALALVIRMFHPRFHTPERYLMPYPQLLHVYALGDNNVTLQFASMAFTIQGAGIIDPILDGINDRSLKGLQQFHAARWPAVPSGAPTIETIVAIDPQAMMQGREAERSA